MKQRFTFLSSSVLFLLFSLNSMAVSVFTVKGVALVCPSCNCAAMQAKGASFENCVDLAINGGSGFDKIIRYSDKKAVLHSADGKELPLASDDVQDQFNELIKYPGWEKQLPALRISEGLISDKRLTEIANLTGLQIEGITAVTMTTGDSKKWKPGKPSFILQLNANGAKSSGATISKDLRLNPNINLQANFKQWGIALDAGLYTSNPEFDFDNYYAQFESLGLATYEKANDQWKSRYFSIGPQYTYKFKLPGSATAGQSEKTVDLTFSLKGGYTSNKSPEIKIYDSSPPFTTVAQYYAPDSIKTNGFNFKPGFSATYWITKSIGASVNIQYILVTGTEEFSTGYRDLSNVNFDLPNDKEIWYQITRSPVVSSTTKGPGNLLSFGAGISVKFGSGKSQTEIPAETSSVKVDTKTTVPVPPVEPAAPGATAQTDVPVAPAINKNETERKPDKDYIRPSILSPANGSNISTSDAEKPVILNWTPVLPPPPAGNVVYQIKLVEVSTNQTADQAIRSNKALLDKSIYAATSTSWSPPQTTASEAKKYAWNVRATDKTGKPYGENNGTSETAAFMLGQNDIDISIDSLTVECCKDGKQLVKITVKNNLSNSNTILKKIWIMAVNGNFGIPYPIDITGMVSPPLPFSFLPSSASVSQGRMNLTASIDCIKDIKTIVLKAEGERNTNLGLVTDNDLEADTLKCICTDCDNIVIEMPENVVHNYTGNSISFTTPVLVSPKKVTKVTADVVYFSFIPESEDCAPCNKDSKSFGNLLSASLNANGFPAAAAIPYGNEAVWISNNPAGANLNGQFSFNITMPPLVKCCSAKVRYCIRYSFQFEDCTVCDKVICYSFDKKGCNQ